MGLFHIVQPDLFGMFRDDLRGIVCSGEPQRLGWIHFKAVRQERWMRVGR